MEIWLIDQFNFNINKDILFRSDKYPMWQTEGYNPVISVKNKKSLTISD